MTFLILTFSLFFEHLPVFRTELMLTLGVLISRPPQQMATRRWLSTTEMYAVAV